jgi:hypothetical protein
MAAWDRNTDSGAWVYPIAPDAASRPSTGTDLEMAFYGKDGFSMCILAVMKREESESAMMFMRLLLDGAISTMEVTMVWQKSDGANENWLYIWSSYLYSRIERVVSEKRILAIGKLF